eukprot:6191758-Pleurochrysis_carterae.AAC.1
MEKRFEDCQLVRVDIRSSTVSILGVFCRWDSRSRGRGRSCEGVPGSDDPANFKSSSRADLRVSMPPGDSIILDGDPTFEGLVSMLRIECGRQLCGESGLGTWRRPLSERAMLLALLQNESDARSGNHDMLDANGISCRLIVPMVFDRGLFGKRIAAISSAPLRFPFR